MYIKKDFIKPDSVERRDYQINIAKSSFGKNSLVVLPTGLGKTVIALILIAEELKEKRGKVLFLAPTKPLVNQHADFLREFLTIKGEDIVVFTGDVSPEMRSKVWDGCRVVVSTPQVIQNDLLNRRFSLEDVSFIVFDEAHHAAGDYAYVFVSDMYKRQCKDGHVLGITASPGNDIDKIREVCQNLGIDNIEIRSKYDSDVKPYVHDLKIDWKEVFLPGDFLYTVQLLKKALSSRLKKLKEVGVLQSASVSGVNKRKLLDAQKLIQKEIRASPKPSKGLFKAASVQSEAMKIHYALELFQTQGVNAFRNYFKRMSKEAASKGGSKASRNLIADSTIVEAVASAKSLNVEHPKIPEIANIIRRQLRLNPDSRVIVFTHYRDTSSNVCNVLDEIDEASPVRFVGQSSKVDDKGLSQKDQIKLIKKFKKGEYNVLIATSVAEEGLDIPSTDLVVFYEPVPSEIRLIQRRGRTARKMPGRVIILITKGTSDEGYYWSAKRKERRMRSELDLLRSKIEKELKDPESFFREYKKDKSNQKNLEEFSKNKKEEVQIVVDNREYRSDVVKNLAVKGIFVEPSQLDVGDYVLSSRIGVERKEVDDFLDSMISGKLFKQISSLKDTYSRPVLVIEGERLLERRNINHNAIFGSLASISVDFGVTILSTKNSSETADLLYTIAKREQREDKKVVVVRGDKPMMSLRGKQHFLIEGLPNVSAVLARRLLSHFGSIKALVNASEEDLMHVKGVGKNIASDIVDLLKAEYGE